MDADTYADDQREREREIRHLGSGSGWPCQARDDAEESEAQELRDYEHPIRGLDRRVL